MGSLKPRAPTACKQTGSSHQVRLILPLRDTEEQVKGQTLTSNLEDKAGFLPSISVTTPCVSTQHKNHLPESQIQVTVLPTTV